MFFIIHCFSINFFIKLPFPILDNFPFPHLIYFKQLSATYIPLTFICLFYVFIISMTLICLLCVIFNQKVCMLSFIKIFSISTHCWKFQTQCFNFIVIFIASKVFKTIFYGIKLCWISIFF